MVLTVNSINQLGFVAETCERCELILRILFRRQATSKSLDMPVGKLFNISKLSHMLFEYRMAKKSLNFLVKYTVKYLINFFKPAEVTIFRNEILRLQCPTHNAVLL
jgi:hypothetical protein